VSITVQVVNDAPVSANDSYSVQVNGTLNVNTPGVLSNDTDVDSASLTVGLVTSSTHGTLTLNSNGSFTYTPTSGYIGSDSFTYRASDGQATSGTATVNLTVTAATPIFTANFNSGQDSFTYVDNTFRGTNQASYASGSRVATGGFTGGALRVVLGGINNTTITGMSGGWRRTFTLSAATALTLSFRYNLNQGADYESDEFSQVMASIDGVLKGVSPNDYVAQVTGNGNGGAAITTGWQQVQISLGTLPAGTHTLILGGYNNKKNSATESTTILIDDVTVRP
jgi:VCBS repeat-containing protein